MKVALVAILRDEASDILSWLGWHIAIGIDTFVLFDDGSRDGTRDLLRDAATLHDIRIYAIDNSDGSHLGRQQAAYIAALDGLREGFDWVGFLDADEYLALHRHGSVQAFLSDFPDDVGAVAVNWCNYGSGGHVTKPVMPPFFAFMHHYSRDQAINRHVKSFVRPCVWSGIWKNVHYFEPRERRYVDPEGRDVSWSEQPGIIATLPAWDTARILHYQLRSMEHFVERARRRMDIVLRPENFTHADHNDLYDPRPAALMAPVMNWVRKAVFQGIARGLDKIVTEMPVPPSFPSSHDDRPVLRFFAVSPAEGGDFEVHDGSLRVVVEKNTDQQLYALQIGAMQEQVFLFVGDSKGRRSDFRIAADNRLLGILPYALVSSSIPDRFAFRQSQRHTYLTATPPHHGGAVIADRREVQDWELFSLCPVQDTDAIPRLLEDPALRFIGRALTRPMSLGWLAYLSREDIRQTVICLPVLMVFMGEEEMDKLERVMQPLLHYLR